MRNIQTLKNWFLDHKDDIENQENDFGELKDVFDELMKNGDEAEVKLEFLNTIKTQVALSRGMTGLEAKEMAVAINISVDSYLKLAYNPYLAEG